jgi:hypothetical protein
VHWPRECAVQTSMDPTGEVGFVLGAALPGTARVPSATHCVDLVTGLVSVDAGDFRAVPVMLGLLTIRWECSAASGIFMGAEMILLGIGNTLPNRGTFTLGAPLPAPSRPLIHCNE